MKYQVQVYGRAAFGTPKWEPSLNGLNESTYDTFEEAEEMAKEWASTGMTYRVVAVDIAPVEQPRYQVQVKRAGGPWKPSENGVNASTYDSLAHAAELAEKWGRQGRLIGLQYRVFKLNPTVAKPAPKPADTYRVEANFVSSGGWRQSNDVDGIYSKKEAIEKARTQYVKLFKIRLSYRVVNNRTEKVVYRVQALSKVKETV